MLEKTNLLGAAAAVMQLIEAGKFSLDTRVVKYLNFMEKPYDRT